MPYRTLHSGGIKYVGNRLNSSTNIDYKEIKEDFLMNRVKRIHEEELFHSLVNIDNAIFFATVEYFKKLGSKWANLPLTTLMISSPGEVYAGQKLDYTTDTLPIEIQNRFGTDKRVFLAESSQFYLELYLLINGLDSVFSIYNSFRKEKSDATHLSEFQHIEYEGKIGYEENIRIFMGLYEHIVKDVFKNNISDIEHFLTDKQIEEKLLICKKGPIRIPLKEALGLLYNDTHDKKYKDFSLKHFGTWEEIRLTEILGGNVIIEQFPMLQIPFYHETNGEEIDGVPVAKNADLILHGYRETIGSGERIKNKEALLKKAEIFNLPKADYLPYLASRDFDDYQITSGFGLGRQRLVHRITNQPFIYESTVIPRTHLMPNP